MVGNTVGPTGSVGAAHLASRPVYHAFALNLIVNVVELYAAASQLVAQTETIIYYGKAVVLAI